ncbi:MAG: Mrp/NBP35 family ATP-binding protein [Planctomycetota bacterium]
MSVTESAVLDALRAVQDPDLHRDIVTLGFVKDVRIDGGAVSFQVELTTPACPVKDQLRQQSHDVVAALPGVSEVHVEMTANVPRQAGAAPSGGNPIPNVRNVLAVGAGKGGVGKSTVAINLALALRRSGASVGLLDADVYGPSIPTMLGSPGRARVDQAKNRILPTEVFDLKVMSIGFVLDPEKPMIVRGPIVHTAIRQFLGDVEWGELDYLVVDLPPGTGDVVLSLAQTVPVTGAVVVSTPQDVSLDDVRKAVNMFRTLKVPVLGLVENMSYYLCPSCGHRDEIFGHGGAERWAETETIPFLGAIPLHGSVRAGGDAGTPALADADAPDAVKDAFTQTAEALARQVSIHVLSQPQAPLVQIEGLS